jgi:PAS domain S-box-containing protein
MKVNLSLAPILQTTLQIVMKLPVPVFLLCGEEGLFFYNDAFTESLEPAYRNAFSSGVPVSEVWPDRWELLRPVVEGIWGGGAGMSSEKEFFPLVRVWKSKPLRWVYCFEGIVDENGQVAGVLVTCVQQVMESGMARRLMESELEMVRDELEGQKRIYEAIAASTPDLVYVIDLNYKFVYANKALLTMWGRSWEDSIGQGLLALGYEPWHAEMHEREIDTVAATRKSIRGEVSFPHTVLGPRIYDYIFAPVLDEKGEVIGIAGTTRDISELKAAEDALRRSEERLEQVVSERTRELQRSNEDLLQFAHVASHDLKEPTRKVRFFADRVLQDPGTQLSPEGRKYVEKINSAADRMFQMIEGVLNYSKATNLTEIYAPVDVAELIRQISVDLEVLIQQKEARIETHDLPSIYGAPVLLYQLFYNLINNSLKFARKGVSAVIVIKAAGVDGGRVRIDVRDNGIGFPQEYAESVFATFTRLHPKDHYEGTGLGLSLCKKIVERHGGTIEAMSHVGEGTLFRIELPVG